jgi:hypothetical protein
MFPYLVSLLTVSGFLVQTSRGSVIRFVLWALMMKSGSQAFCR